MEQYTIYCTEEQTKKALELGAPIEFKFNKVYYLDGSYTFEVEEKNGEQILENPTAEQMIGWLEEQEIMESIEVQYYHDDGWVSEIYMINGVCIERSGRSSRKEATLAAVDAALNYLMRIKK